MSLASNQRLNSWIHNIQTKSKVSKDVSTNKSNIDLITNTINTTDPHLLKLGDPVTLLDTSSAIAQNVVGTVSLIVSANAFQINITSGSLSIDRDYEVKLNTIFASHNDPNVVVNNFVGSNVQNTYIDKSRENVFVTSEVHMKFTKFTLIIAKKLLQIQILLITQLQFKVMDFLVVML